MKTASCILAIFFVAALALAETNHDWLKHVSEGDRSRVNPYQDKADAVAAGSKLYGQHCAKCHGADLQGVRNKPSLHSETVQHATDGELFWKITEGKKPMPTYEKLLSATDRWNVVNYIRTLAPPPAPASDGGKQ